MRYFLYLLLYLALVLVILALIPSARATPPVTVAVTPVPVALFTYVGAPTTPAPVTISPTVLAAQQQQAAAVQQQREAAFVAELRALRAEVARLSARQQTQQVVPSGPPPIAEEADAPPAVAATPLVAETREQLIIRAASIMQQKCAACHSGAEPRGEVKLFRADGAFEPEASWRMILASVTKTRRRMPLGDPTPLSAEEMEPLRKLADEEIAARK